jgi:pimeloyl-ACP methyl ester carboxylesterase
MRTELITIATDATPLDGAFYQPDDGGASQGVLLLHGNTMNFYVGPPRFLPPALTTLGFACLAFNRRGHDILTIRDSFGADGGAFQRTQDGIDDNRHAARWMAERGFPAPAVIGHSYGGILGVRHACDHPATPALVLLSTYRGGSHTWLAQHKRGFLAGDRLEETLAAARSMIAAGRGRDLIPVPGWPYAISAESYLDRMATMPDIVMLAPAVPCPVLFVRGDREPTPAIPADEFAARASRGCDLAVVANCDHFYVGPEDAVCRVVSDWLSKTLAAGHLHAG